MAEIQQFNLGQLLGQAEQIKGARRQNQLAELLQPLQMEEAQLGLANARSDRTARLAGGALALMGKDWTSPEAWARGVTWAEQQGADVTPFKDGPSVEKYKLIQQLAGSQQGKSIQSTYIDDQGQRVAIYRDGTTSVLGRAGTTKKMVDGVLIDVVTGEAFGTGGGSGLSDDEIRARQQAEARRQADAAAGVKGAEESAKAGVRLQTEPEITSAVVTAREEAQAAAARRQSQATQAGKIEDFDTAYKQLADSDLDIIYGKGEKWMPEYLRSQRGIDLMARRDQIIGLLQLGARGEIKGQGPITDADQELLARAITILQNPNISPPLAREALDQARAIIYKSAGQQSPAAQQQPATQGGIDSILNRYR